jgi:hypothetical protein
MWVARARKRPPAQRLFKRHAADATLLLLLVILACEPIPGASTGVLPDLLPTRYRTQGRFTAALEQPISATWRGISIRSLLRRLSRDREIAILLDRRVDPDQEAGLDTGARSLRSAVDELGRLANLGVTQVGNCLMIAPPAAAGRLRTLVALRQQELSAGDVDDSNRASQLKSRHATVAWSDLDRPADIVAAIAAQFGLALAGTERIPHDLWAGAAIPEATAPEALSLVLNQFDLTFEWTSHGAGVRLVPIPPKIAIKRTYALRGRSAAETLRMLQTKIDELQAETRGNTIIVRGTIEQHEVVASLLGLAKEGPRPVRRGSVPLERQSFSLQVHGISLRDLLDQLKQQDIPIEYDADTLRKAGIDLEQKVSLDLPKLPSRKFFARLLEPYGLKFRFKGATVIVEPK